MNMFYAEDALTALDDHMRKVESKRCGPVEERPAPLDLSADQILDWLNEYADQVVFSKGSDEYPGYWHVYVDEFDRPASGRSIRQAVNNAAAKLREINE